MTVDLADASSQPPRETFTLRVMQIGAIAVVVVASTLMAFELDRFFVPKELVLHLTAVLAALTALPVRFTRTDRLLAIYLALNIVAAVFATNHWLALRALAVTASGLLIFWSARALRVANREQSLLGALAIAVVVAAVTSLLQTYGVETTLFSENRSPGGTFGNRNFVAHIAAFGAPLLLFFALRARTFVFGAIGFAMVVATLVLTRSRAAWLAFAAAMIIVVIGMLIRRDARAWGRFALTFVFAAAGVAAALLVPNTLRWRSGNPYVESAKRVVDFEGGSGRGRLIQYEHSLMMAVRHPLFGVGPGNWPVEYPANAARNDPSIDDSDPGMTFNPWPSSDWIAWISERGFAAAAVLLLVFIAIGIAAVRQIVSSETSDDALRGVILLAVLVAVIIAGLFDAVLLIAAPTLLVWAAIGALWQPRYEWSTALRRWVAVIAIVIAFAGLVRSASQLFSMTTYVMTSDRASLERAATIDPGNYRLEMRLARMGGRHRCDHGRAALRLMPHSREATAVACRGRTFTSLFFLRSVEMIETIHLTEKKQRSEGATP